MRIYTAATILAAALFCSACAPVTRQGRELDTANNLFAEKRYADAMSTYRSVIRNNPDPRTDAEARFRLAYALSFYENPQPDYAKSIQEFEEFLRLYPEHEKAADAKNLRHILRTLERLNKNIEELKKLDIRHEEKRKKRQVR